MSSKQYIRTLLSLVLVTTVISCGDAPIVTGPESGESHTLTKPGARTAVIALEILDETGAPVSEATVNVSRAVSGAVSASGWTGTTDADGQVQITIQATAGRYRQQGAAGYYTVTATAAGNEVGRWSSVPINGDGENVLTCQAGRRPTVHPRGPVVRVMTRNLYLGADINRVLLAEDPTQIPLLVAQTWGVVQQTNFAERAAALADEIKAARPHLIGLQEVSLFRMQDPGDLLIGGQTLPTEVALDFLAILLDALEARGLFYTAAAVSEGIDIELPLAKSATEFADIRLTDREVILVRNGVAIDDVIEAKFQAAVPITVGGTPTSIPRAYASVKATVAGRDIRFITTHLETGAAEPIQAFQAAELVGLVAADVLPAILVGDFNSDAYGTTTATYAETLIPGGLVDVWGIANPSELGLTGSQQEDLLNASTLNRRIDLIFVRGSDDLSPLNAEVVGDDEADRTPSGLWPSDHAGVTASIRLPSVRPF